MLHLPLPVLIYVIGMVATAIAERIDSASSDLIVEHRGQKYDMRTPAALFFGLIWPIWWAYKLATRLPFIQKPFIRWLRRRGMEFQWSTATCEKPIPGLLEDYPAVDGTCIRLGRRVGKWGMLLTVNALGDGRWANVSWHRGRKPQHCLIDIYESEDEAREAFRWTRERELDEAESVSEDIPWPGPPGAPTLKMDVEPIAWHGEKL